MDYQKYVTDAFSQLEEALQHVESLVNKQTQDRTDTKTNSTRTLRTMKVLLKQKQHLLDATTLETPSSELPHGHVVTLYYRRQPTQGLTFLKTEPVNTKPWLHNRVKKQQSPYRTFTY